MNSLNLINVQRSSIRRDLVFRDKEHSDSILHFRLNDYRELLLINVHSAIKVSIL